jgi:hypothetical protein
MKGYTVLPLLFLKFWYIEAPLGMLAFFESLNSAFFQLFSLGLFVRTFFKPLKNEYRQGLVGFSIGMGMFVKTFLIFADLLLFAALLLFEIAAVVLFIIFPVLTVVFLFL